MSMGRYRVIIIKLFLFGTVFFFTQEIFAQTELVKTICFKSNRSGIEKKYLKTLKKLASNV
jgi:hypothetical protein